MLDTFRPAEETVRRFAERGWIRFLVLPERSGFRDDQLPSLAEVHRVPWSYQICDLKTQDRELLLAAICRKLVPTEYLQR